MSKGEVFCKIKLEDGNTGFTASCREQDSFKIDTLPPIGSGNGYTPVELLLLGLTSCVSLSLAVLLRRKCKKTVADVQTDSQGFYKDEPVFQLCAAELAICLSSEDVSSEDVTAVLNMAKAGPSMVWYKLSGSMDININVTVTRANGSSFTIQYKDPAKAPQ